MCKFEDVKMCRFSNKFLVALLVLIISSGSMHAQNTDDLADQFARTYRFIEMLPTQNFDSISTLLTTQLKSDTVVKADILKAGSFVAKGKSSMIWVYERLSTHSIECRYIDRDNEHKTLLLITLTFGQGILSSTISSIHILDEVALKKTGQDSEPIDFPPPATEAPPPTPKPR